MEKTIHLRFINNLSINKANVVQPNKNEQQLIQLSVIPLSYPFLVYSNLLEFKNVYADKTL